MLFFEIPQSGEIVLRNGDDCGDEKNLTKCKQKTEQTDETRTNRDY